MGMKAKPALLQASPEAVIFPGEGIVQGMAWGGSRLADQSCLHGIDYGHVQCCVPTPGPVGDKDISRISMAAVCAFVELFLGFRGSQLGLYFFLGVWDHFNLLNGLTFLPSPDNLVRAGSETNITSPYV